LANEIRRRFGYAIDPKSGKFMRIFSAATILHPEFYSLLPNELFNAGKEEIVLWVNRLPSQQTTSAPIHQSTLFKRLPTQRLVSGNSGIEFDRYVWLFVKIIIVFI
jgi:hypothetical protein